MVRLFFIFISFYSNAYGASVAIDKLFDGVGYNLKSFNLPIYGSCLSVSENRIAVAGTLVVSPTEVQFGAIIYNKDGSVFTSFGQNGIAKISLGGGFRHQLNGCQFQKDGKLLLLGSYWSSENQNSIIIRLNTDGTLDSTFGVGGKLIAYIGVSFGPPHDVAMNAIEDDSGNLYIGGWYNGDYPLQRVLYILKLKSNGAYDTSFSSDGIEYYNSNGSKYLCRMQFDNNKKIVLLGVGVNGFTLGRINSSTGAFDSTFNGGSEWLNNLGGVVHRQGCAMAIDSANNIFVGGTFNFYSTSRNKKMGIAKLTSTGSLDSSFNNLSTPGYILLSNSGNSSVIEKEDIMYSLFLGNDNLLYGVGTSYNGYNKDIVLFRLNSNGTQDTTFGFRKFPVPGGSMNPIDVFSQGTENYLGVFGNGIGVIKFKLN